MATQIVEKPKDRSAARDHSAAIDTALLIARLFLGTVFIAHGSQKLLGAFGGDGRGVS